MPVLPLLTARERTDARRLVESKGLVFDETCDEIVGLYEADRLVATAARAGYVLEMFAIDEDVQGGDVLGQLISGLTASARRAGHDALFVYTRPQNAASFEACGFALLVACGDVVLLEHGAGLDRYLLGAPTRRVPAGARVGAIVVNGNPFTRGHLYLVDTAAARLDLLYLFVVREDRSVFPFEGRFQMAREATRHLANVVLLDTSRYAVSAGTFPSYFLRRSDEAARLQMEVDARLFGARIAPAFSISRRFVGHEPYCATTAAYNDVLAAVLPEYGVTLEVIPRTADTTGFVSATRVRAALARDDLDTVGRLVPETTVAWLRTDAGRAVTETLKARETT